MKIHLNAKLSHKEIKHETSPCVVEEIIELSENDFARYLNNLFEVQSFIEKNKNIMRKDEEGVYHCLLVLSENYDDGILIAADGYDYARYSSYIPNARQIVFMEQRYTCIQDLESWLTGAADDVVSQAIDFKGDGFMRIAVDDIIKNHLLDKDNLYLFADVLREHSLFNDVIVNDDEIIISINRQGEKEIPLHRPNEDELKIMCAKHILWNHDQPGGEKADFSNMDLTDCYLANADLSGAIFKGATLNSATLGNGSFTFCDFTNAEMQNADAVDAVFEESDFTGAKLVNCHFLNAGFMNCNFTNSDLSGSDFNMAWMGNSNFTGAVTDTAKFENARMNNCTGLSAAPDEDENNGMSMQ